MPNSVGPAQIKWRCSLIWAFLVDIPFVTAQWWILMFPFQDKMMISSTASLRKVVYGLSQEKSAFKDAQKIRRFRSSCACTKYHPGLCSPFIHSVVSNDSVSRQ